MCRSLGQAGHRVSVLRLTAQQTPTDHSRFCAETLHIGAPDSGVRNYVAALADMLRSRKYDYLIPVDDLACQLTYYDYHVISSSTRVVGPSPSSYALAHNYFEALAVAESIGLVIPVTHLVKEGDLPSASFLPCFIRPVVSCAILDDELQLFTMRKVNTIEELDAKLRDDLPRVDVILQAPLPGASVVLNCCSIDGEVLGASAALRLHESPRDGGCSYRKIEHMTPRLRAVIQAAARHLCWTGFLAVECKEAGGQLLFMKLTGWPNDEIGLSIFAGVDFPNLILNGLEGGHRTRILFPTKTVYMRDLRGDVGWLSSAVKSGGRSKVIARWIWSFGRVLVGRERFDIEQVADPLPAVRQFDPYFKTFWGKMKLHLSAEFHRPKATTASTGALTRSSSLLIVCQGNINRSVVAEHLFRSRGFTGVRSAGLLKMSGRRPSMYAERFLAERLQVDISAFRSRSVARALKEIGDVDMVLCFERSHAAELVRRFRNLSGKVFLLVSVANSGERPLEIADPHGADPATYLACFQRIDKLVDQAVTVITSPCNRTMSASPFARE
jgi:protein-tyrosine-phosphatase/predicted ATP-grasp superfamily ATP-dependent carboligase